MDMKKNLERIVRPSEDIVAREIEGEIILVPLAAGIGDMEDELFSLNETGRAVWQKLDGRKSLGEIARELASEFEGASGRNRRGCRPAWLRNSSARRMLVEISGK